MGDTSQREGSPDRMSGELELGLDGSARLRVKFSKSEPVEFDSKKALILSKQLSNMIPIFLEKQQKSYSKQQPGTSARFGSTSSEDSRRINHSEMLTT